RGGRNPAVSVRTTTCGHGGTSTFPATRSSKSTPTTTRTTWRPPATPPCGPLRTVGRMSSSSLTPTPSSPRRACSTGVSTPPLTAPCVVGRFCAARTDAAPFITPAAVIARCIHAARAGRMHMPFTQQRCLTEAEADDLIAGRGVPLEGRPGNGACYVIRPAAYWQAGGSDERFSGWGGDDDQLVAACTALIGLRRHEGVALSLWHPAVRAVGSPRHRPNAVLARRYWQAIRNPDRMRAIIAERSLSSPG